VDAVHLPANAMGWRVRLRAATRYWLFVTTRTWRHARVLVPTLASGAAWAWSRARRQAGLMNLPRQIESEK
jgi:hypothetical protein